MATGIPLDAVSYANMAIGKDLRRMREESGLSQVLVARKVGVNRSMLCRIESGNGNPTVGTVFKIVKAIEALS